MIRFLDITIDVVFKDFFGDKSSKDILESFINYVLELKGDDQIEIVEFLDPRKMRVEVGKPTTFIDISVLSKSGDRYIIEMQTYNHLGFDKRLLYYLGRDYSEQVGYFEEEKKRRLIDWRNLPRVHVIAITNFHRSESKKDGLLNHQGVVENYTFGPEFSSDNNHLFSNQWRATVIDLTKFPDVSFDELQTDKEKWVYILKNAPTLTEAEAEKLKRQTPFTHALERLERLSSDPRKCREYESSINECRDQQGVMLAAEERGEKKGEEKGLERGRREGKEEGRREGKEEGRKEGEKNKAFEIARLLASQGIPFETITKVTDLSSEELQALSRNSSSQE